MQLSNLLDGFATVKNDISILGLTLNSREVSPGDAFIALSGVRQHGLLFAEDAIKRGAVAIIYDPASCEDVKINQDQADFFIAVDQLNARLGDIAGRYFDEPSAAMNLIGITGTNGKTSCSQFLGQAMDDCGIIGTLGWGEWGLLKTTLNTTPDALAIQAMLAAFRQQGKKSVAMEVSSHGLEQGRVNGITFKGAVYTNISRDHLDYHGSMENYVEAKLRLLAKPGIQFAVINFDDSYSTTILQAVPPNVAVWGTSLQGKQLERGERVLAKEIEQGLDGMQFDLCWRNHCRRVSVELYGDFNVENLLQVCGVLLAMGFSFDETVRRISNIKPVAGRMTRYGFESTPWIFVDYAHTPDALDKVLNGLKKHCPNKLWVVMGCGGDRDAGKRPLMGQIAEKWADHIVLTDDNPRSENSLQIIDGIKQGCSSNKIRVIQDREQAIKTVVREAEDQDCILIAGKGHEAHQEINGLKTPFSDAEVVIRALEDIR
ncbi:MAG: UDP-N-acetylmuramoyl-L-alanyl-D-glutamate--2,6-diaminopimelate ligase [Methylomicrobium sp.]|nr:UDP-N-acetylmuramoyl-L-alanyl-D-glutamate--2,6-diaminopimelate ligase [Methylomicrobium sp.]